MIGRNEDIFFIISGIKFFDLYCIFGKTKINNKIALESKDHFKKKENKYNKGLLVYFCKNIGIERKQDNISIIVRRIDIINKKKEPKKYIKIW